MSVVFYSLTEHKNHFESVTLISGLPDDGTHDVPKHAAILTNV